MKKKEFFGQLESVKRKDFFIEFPYLKSVRVLSFYDIYESFENRYFLFTFPQKRNFIWLSKKEKERVFSNAFDYLRCFNCKYISKKKVDNTISFSNTRIFKFKKLRFLGQGKKRKLVYFFNGCKSIRLVKKKRSMVFKSKLRKKAVVLLFYKNLGKLTYSF